MMKKKLSIFFIILFTITLGLFTSCSSKHSATGSIEEVESSSTTLTVTLKIRDTKDEVKSPFIRLLDSSGNRVKKQDLTEIPSQADDGDWKTETEKLSGLSVDTTYRLELVCTIDKDEVILDSKECQTNSDGTSLENPIEIWTIDDLYQMTNDNDAYYKLMADLTFDSTEAKTAIFNSTTKFEGNFNGNGKTISNFYETENVNYAGLFGYISAHGSVYDLNLSNFKIDIKRTSETFVGLLAGYCDGDITNVNVTDSEILFNSPSTLNLAYIGGLVGQASGTISNCTLNNVTIDETATNYSLIGGFVGEYKGAKANSINQCVSNTTIKVNQNSTTSTTSSSVTVYLTIGGFVGNLSGRISECVSMGTIDAKYEINPKASHSKERGVIIGGFVGYAGYIVSLKDCLAKESISFDSKTSIIAKIGLFEGSGIEDAVKNYVNVIYDGIDSEVKFILLETEEDVEALEDRTAYFGFYGDLAQSITRTAYLENEPTYTLSKFATRNDTSIGKSDKDNLSSFIASYLN